MNRPVKYILVPGTIVSQYDEDQHYINAARLAHLYGVSMDECVVWHTDSPGGPPGPSGALLLLPDAYGRYDKIRKLINE